MMYLSKLNDNDILKEEWEKSPEADFLLNRVMQNNNISPEGISFLHFLFSRVKGPWDENIGDYNYIRVEEYNGQIEITFRDNRNRMVYSL